MTNESNDEHDRLCTFHARHPERADEDCRGCMIARQHHDRARQQAATVEAIDLDQFRTLRTGCPTCHGTSWIEDPDTGRPIARCHHGSTDLATKWRQRRGHEDGEFARITGAWKR